jgi:type IV secretion system protein VirB4
VDSSLKAYKPEVLAIYQHGGAMFSRALELLAYLVNGIWEPVPVANGPIRETLATSRIFFANEKLEIRGPSDTRYAAMLDLRDYPEFSEPGLLNPILYHDYEYIETQSFSVLAKPDAIEALKRQQKQLAASADIGTSQIAAMDSALDQLGNGKFVLGEYHYTLAVLGETTTEVDASVARARASLHDQGFQTALIDLVADAAWFAQLPCNWKYRPRKALITSRNFCGQSAFHNFAAGKRDGNPWGEAVTIFKTPSGQPFYFNFHATPDDEDSEDKKALGNTVIIGQSGQGKTVLELFTLAMAMKYGLTAVLFDLDRGMEIAVRAMGGRYRAFVRGEPTGLNPLQMEPTEENVQYWTSFVGLLVAAGPHALLADEQAAIAHAVATVARMPQALRRLSTVRQNLIDSGTNSLNLRLKRWCAGEPLGWVFDNPTDEIDFESGNLFGFDDTEIVDIPEVSRVVTQYLLYATNRLIDGRRFCYVMTEFWKRLADPVFADFATKGQKTIRKKSGFGVFDTQSPSDVLASGIAKTMVEQAGTQIFLPNPRADRDDYVGGFKVSDAEFEIIRRLGDGSRRFLVKQGHQSAIVELDLSGMGDVLDILSSTEENARLLDAIRGEVGDDPAIWRPIFHERLALRRANRGPR